MFAGALSLEQGTLILCCTVFVQKEMVDKTTSPTIHACAITQSMLTAHKINYNIYIYIYIYIQEFCY